MSKRTLLFSFTLCFALVFSLWLIHHYVTQTSDNSPTRKKTPDAFMKNAQYVSYDTNGNLHNKISMTKMFHYTSDNTSYFTQPNIIFYSNEGAPWFISAVNGQSKDGIDTVHLWDNVKIYEPPSKKNHELTITTSSLTIFPETKTAKTDQAIKIVQPGTSVSAVGLWANLKKGEVELYSQAQVVDQSTN